MTYHGTAQVVAGALALLLMACVHKEEELVDIRSAASATPQAASTDPILSKRHDELNSINYNVSTSEELAKIDNGAEGDVYFTDPTNPDKEIEGITAAFEARRRGHGWLSDYTQATRLSRKERKPLIIWFHDSVISPKSKTLGAQLLNTKSFNNWCEDRVIRLKLDSGASLDDTRPMRVKYSAGAINSLARRYGLRRKPALAVISPDGQLMDKVDGFDGFLDEVRSTIEHGVEASEKKEQAYRAELVQKGYRDWTNARGDKRLFARLHRMDEIQGMVYFKEPGGKISHTPLQNLSQEDMALVDEYTRDSGDQKP